MSKAQINYDFEKVTPDASYAKVSIENLELMAKSAKDPKVKECIEKKIALIKSNQTVTK